jgi:hypothetical protein
LALIRYLAQQLFRRDFGATRINHGLNEVRFPAPAPVGSSLRAKAGILDLRDGPAASPSPPATSWRSTTAPKPHAPPRCSSCCRDAAPTLHSDSYQMTSPKSPRRTVRLSMDRPPSAEAGASGLNAPVGARGPNIGTCRFSERPHRNLRPGNCSVKQRGGQRGEQPSDRRLTAQRIRPSARTYVRRSGTLRKCTLSARRCRNPIRGWRSYVRETERSSRSPRRGAHRQQRSRLGSGGLSRAQQPRISCHHVRRLPTWRDLRAGQLSPCRPGNCKPSCRAAAPRRSCVRTGIATTWTRCGTKLN